MSNGPRVCKAGDAAVSRHAVEIKTVNFPGDGRTVVQANVASMYYDPVRATVSPTATVRVVGAEYNTAALVLSQVSTRSMMIVAVASTDVRFRRRFWISNVVRRLIIIIIVAASCLNWVHHGCC